MLKVAFFSPISRSLGNIKKFIQNSLARRLLVFTVLFVVLSELLILAPVIAKYRYDWLHNHVVLAQIAVLSEEASPTRTVATDLRDELLKNAGVYEIILHRPNSMVLTLGSNLPHPVDETFNLHNAGLPVLLRDAFKTYLRPDGRVISLVERPHFDAGTSIEVVMSETPLRHVLIYEGIRVFWLSLTVLIPATMFSTTLLYFIFVRPMRRLTESMVAFRKDPSDLRRIVAVTGRLDEIGVAERELHLMQSRIHETLTQNARFAALGRAVSKVNHDLRNMLANAQLLSDRIGAIDDPTVRLLAPRLFLSIDRASELCTQTLHYGRVDEEVPVRLAFPLKVLVNEVRDTVGLPTHGKIVWTTQIGSDLMIDADREHLYRILLNLARNAVQAIQADRQGAGKINVSAVLVADHVHIDIVDTGPGLPEKAKAHLFEAFAGGTREGGFGLGLAIADELARTHGGHIDLIATSEAGTHFRLCIPAINSVADCEGKVLAA